MKAIKNSDFIVARDEDKCIQCRVCENQCPYETHVWDEEEQKLHSRDDKCVGCQRCVSLCPTGALSIAERPVYYKGNAYWKEESINDIKRQADTGGILLTGMGNDREYPVYWDKILLNASQVTNPSIDPLREPMEIRSWIGARPDKFGADENVKLPPLVPVEVPMLFSAISYGAISANVQKSLGMAAREMKTLWNTGEGGLSREVAEFSDNAIVQVASGRFGVNQDYLDAGRIVEIKIGQGAKPGIGGHLPGHKVSAPVAEARLIPEGSDAISPAPHHDIYSIEDLSQLIAALKEATNYSKPISVKIAAVHNVAAIASGVVRAGADIIAIDGFRGSTGAAPKVIRDNVGIPIEMALAVVDERLRSEGIRNRVSILVAGGFRNSGDIVKAVALGADAVYIGTAALIALGCTVCQKCYTGKCPWGITTTDPRLSRRINPEIGAERLVNLLRGWSHEIREMLGGMGINAIESLRGNRDHLRGIGLNEKELQILNIRMAGE